MVLDIDALKVSAMSCTQCSFLQIYVFAMDCLVWLCSTVVGKCHLWWRVLLMHTFLSVHCSRQTTLRLVSLYRNNSTFGDPWLTSVPARKCLHTIFLMAFLVVRMLPFLPRHTPLSCSYENLCWVCRVWSNLFLLLRWRSSARENWRRSLSLSAFQFWI